MTRACKSVVGFAGFAWALVGGALRDRRFVGALGFPLRSCSVWRGLARLVSASTMSRHVGTRKMVNYAWPG